MFCNAYFNIHIPVTDLLSLYSSRAFRVSLIMFFCFSRSRWITDFLVLISSLNFIFIQNNLSFNWNSNLWNTNYRLAKTVNPSAKIDKTSAKDISQRRPKPLDSVGSNSLKGKARSDWIVLISWINLIFRWVSSSLCLTICTFNWRDSSEISAADDIEEY